MARLLGVVLLMLALLPICLSGCSSGRQHLAAREVRRIVRQVDDLTAQKRYDDAIRILKPLGPVYGDTLWDVGGGRRVSVVGMLGDLYWFKRDAEHALPYEEIAGDRYAPTGIDEVTPLDVITQCRRILVARGRKDLHLGLVVNDVQFAKVVTIDGVSHVDLKRMATLCGARLREQKPGRSWTLSRGHGMIRLAVDGEPLAGPRIRLRVSSTGVKAPIRQLVRLLGGTVRVANGTRLICADVP